MRKRVVLKLTGEVIKQTESGLEATLLETIAEQVKSLTAEIQFGIVMGGGNFFRGTQQGTQMHLSEHVGHTVGMLATMMNGLIIQEIFEKVGIATTLFSALEAEDIGYATSPQNIRTALDTKDCLIFAGGTGNPYFTTDTTAVLRALQIKAAELWKGTKVDGIYTGDPIKDPSAKLLKEISYKDAINKRLSVMDIAAFALAEQHKLQTRIFNIFTDKALLRVASDKGYGSTIDN